jgi:RNA ligase
MTTSVVRMQLDDLVDAGQLAEMLDAGYVKRQYHPGDSAVIFNYTEKTQFENAWNDVTRHTRGLIVRGGEIIARPWSKFYNHGQPGAADLDLTAPVEVTDKMDGSLGILYPGPDGWAIATRGSFASPQAKHGTAVLRERYADFTPPAGVTVLFEIVYPANRIVLDYGTTDDLVLLGGVDIATGRTLGPAEVPGWEGPVTGTFQARTLAEALAMPPRDNAEGLVVRRLDTGGMVKIKQGDYLALHRILTWVTARVLWTYVAINECKDLIEKPKHWGTRLGLDRNRAVEILQVGPDWLAPLTAQVPDEFHAWVRATIDGFHQQVADLRRSLEEELPPLVAQAAGDRLTLWNLVRDRPHYGALMLMHDGRDITTQLWRAVYPPPTKPWVDQLEDVA